MSDVADDKAVEIVETKEETQEQERRGISLSVKDICFNYGGVVALDKISFDIEPGERVGIIGNSGSGKSTLCDIITGLKSPKSGTISINGKNVTSKSASSRAKKGMRRVFQSPVFFENLNVEENVLVGSPPSKGDDVISSLFLPRLFYKERRETARRILEYCHVDIEESQSLKVLPVSLKKRIELARTLMGNPRILVLDEPASSLNEEERAQYCQVVLDYVETFATTLIVVDHDLEFIRSLSNRAIALDAGELLADGEVVPVLRNEAVKNRYLNGMSAK